MHNNKGGYRWQAIKARAPFSILDGTLLDSMGVWDQVDIDFLSKRGIDVPDDYMTKVAAMQFRQIAEYTIARFSLTDTPEELMDEWDHMTRVMYATVVEAKPYAREYLAQLKESGAKLAVATSLPPMLREPAMKHVGIFDYFDEVVSVDDAGDVGKDQPDVYLLAASRLGVEPEECTVFEDLLIGHAFRQVGWHEGMGHARRFVRCRLAGYLRSGGWCHVRLP